MLSHRTHGSYSLCSSRKHSLLIKGCFHGGRRPVRQTEGDKRGKQRGKRNAP